MAAVAASNGDLTNFRELISDATGRGVISAAVSARALKLDQEGLDRVLPYGIRTFSGDHASIPRILNPEEMKAKARRIQEETDDLIMLSSILGETGAVEQVRGAFASDGITGVLKSLFGVVDMKQVTSNVMRQHKLLTGVSDDVIQGIIDGNSNLITEFEGQTGVRNLRKLRGSSKEKVREFLTGASLVSRIANMRFTDKAQLPEDMKRRIADALVKDAAAGMGADLVIAGKYNDIRSAAEVTTASEAANVLADAGIDISADTLRQLGYDNKENTSVEREEIIQQAIGDIAYSAISGSRDNTVMGVNIGKARIEAESQRAKLLENTLKGMGKMPADAASVRALSQYVMLGGSAEKLFAAAQDGLTMDEVTGLINELQKNPDPSPGSSKAEAKNDSIEMLRDMIDKLVTGVVKGLSEATIFLKTNTPDQKAVPQ
jgi:hypothetical protein